MSFDPVALREKYRQERDKRLRADGIRQYRMSASARSVPDPHIGSTSGVSPSHPVIAMAAAATVSCMGAVTVALRYPRRCIEPPEVSTLIVAELLWT